MKKIFYTLLVSMAVAFTTTHATAQPGYPPSYNQVRFESFFYYPQSNVYYSFRTHQYIYPMQNRWEISYRLPRYIRIGREDRVTVEHRGFDVWVDNERHQYMYGRRYNQAPPAIVYAPERRYNGY